MPFKEVVADRLEGWEFCPEKKADTEFSGPVCEGYLAGCRKGTGAFKSNLYKFFADKEQQKAFGVWGATVIDNKLVDHDSEEVKIELVGCRVRITWLGEKKSASGRQSYNDYKVEADPNDKIRITPF